MTNIAVDKNRTASPTQEHLATQEQGEPAPLDTLHKRNAEAEIQTISRSTSQESFATTNEKSIKERSVDRSQSLQDPTLYDRKVAEGKDKPRSRLGRLVDAVKNFFLTILQKFGLLRTRTVKVDENSRLRNKSSFETRGEVDHDAQPKATSTVQLIRAMFEKRKADYVPRLSELGELKIDMFHSQIATLEELLEQHENGENMNMEKVEDAAVTLGFINCLFGDPEPEDVLELRRSTQDEVAK